MTEKIEYCQVIEDWSTYHEESIGCDCDMFEARKCQNSGNETCSCQCHLIHNYKQFEIKVDCIACNHSLNQAKVILTIDGKTLFEVVNI